VRLRGPPQIRSLVWQANAVVEQILSYFDLTPKYDIYITDHDEETATAIAKFDAPLHKRIIIFNKEFMRQIIDVGGHWAAYSVAAHEVGHHMKLHFERQISPYDAELEADFYSGFVLGKLGASFDDTIGAIKWFPPSTDHPARTARRDQINRGWKEATGKLTPEDERPPPIETATPQGTRQYPNPAPVISKRASVLERFDWRNNRDSYGSDLPGPTGRPGISGISLEGGAIAI
jgi:hypothetical protein